MAGALFSAPRSLRGVPIFSVSCLLIPRVHIHHQSIVQKCIIRQRPTKIVRICCMSSNSKSDSKLPSRSAHIFDVLKEAEQRSSDIGKQPIPKITLDHVKLSFARSGGAGGQNVNKVSTKVDMRFNVAAANWLSPYVKEKIMQMEKNRINSDGDLVITSTRTRTQKGNIDDCLEKLQKIIESACYVPPPPSQETKEKIKNLAKISDEKRLQKKKADSQKKSARRDQRRWDD